MTNRSTRVSKAIRTLFRAAGHPGSAVLEIAPPDQGLDELESRTLMSALPAGPSEPGPIPQGMALSADLTVVAAPTALSALSQGASGVLLHWTDHDTAATAYKIFRSTDGVTFAALTTVNDGTATSYMDGAVAVNKAYWYKVRAVEGTKVSALTAAAKVTTALGAPTNLVASVSGVKVGLTWSDPNGTGLGYIILRSSDGTTFTTLARLAAGAARSFTDATVSAGNTYFYRVEAVKGTQVSSAGNTANAAMPDGAGGVTITTRYGNELVITSYGADSILVSEIGSILTIIADGQSFTRMVLAAGVFIYDRAGNDTITIDSSVGVRTTVTSIGGGIDRVVSGDANVSAWLDTTDFFSGAGVVHWIGALAGNVSKAVGASLPNPKDSGTTFKLNDSLFGTGPVAGDVNQGGVGDCYFLSSLAAFAGVKPSVLTESAVDMGDGTFIVRFVRQGAPVYVRVSNAISSGNYWGYHFARPGADNTMWALVFEKAFAYFRTGANMYASISSGWMGEVYSDLGVGSSSVSLQVSESAFYSTVSGDLASGRAVTFGTGGSAPQLVSGHAYTLVSASIDSNGVTHYIVRNPWGVSGDSLENSSGYATLTFAQMKANFVLGAQAAA